ncbi:MAG: DHHA1 domain-containing protein [Planctomycetota bacterium]
MQKELRRLRKELEETRREAAGQSLDELVEACRPRGEARVLAALVPGAGPKELLDLCDRLRKKHPSFAGVLLGEDGDAVPVVAVVTKDLVAEGLQAGALVREIAGLLGGGGGGRPEMAQGRGKDASGLEAALARAWELLGG